MPLEHLTLTAGAVERHALVHVPPGAGPRPAVVLLHGSGGSGAWALRETRWDDLADRVGCVVVCPDATRPRPDLPARFYTNPPVWNDGSGLPPADRVRTDDVGFLRALLDELPGRFAVDPRRVFVTGFSNGAGMTFRVAAELADRVAAVAPVAGHCPPVAPRAVPTLYLTGTLDPLIPLHGGPVDSPWAKGVVKPPVAETLRRWAGPVEPVVVRDDGPVRVERWGERLEAWTIAGLGHHWPGGRGELNPRIAGPPSDAVDATAVIWEFFASIS